MSSLATGFGSIQAYKHDHYLHASIGGCGSRVKKAAGKSLGACFSGVFSESWFHLCAESVKLKRISLWN
jgi:hypothetical protein